MVTFGGLYSRTRGRPRPEWVIGSERHDRTQPFSLILWIDEGVIEEFSHRDHGTSRIVSAFVVGNCDDEAKAQRKKHLRSCVDAASGVRSPGAAVLD